MKTFLIIIGIVVAIPIILLLAYVVVMSWLGRTIEDTHETRIKQTIGYDFGDKYELLYSRMQDGMIWVLQFQEDCTNPGK